MRITLAPFELFFINPQAILFFRASRQPALHRVLRHILQLHLKISLVMHVPIIIIRLPNSIALLEKERQSGNARFQYLFPSPAADQVPSFISLHGTQLKPV